VLAAKPPKESKVNTANRMRVSNDHTLFDADSYAPKLNHIIKLNKEGGVTLSKVFGVSVSAAVKKQVKQNVRRKHDRLIARQGKALPVQTAEMSDGTCNVTYADGGCERVPLARLRSAERLEEGARVRAFTTSNKNKQGAWYDATLLPYDSTEEYKVRFTHGTEKILTAGKIVPVLVANAKVEVMCLDSGSCRSATVAAADDDGDRQTSVGAKRPRGGDGGDGGDGYGPANSGINRRNCNGRKGGW